MGSRSGSDDIIYRRGVNADESEDIWDDTALVEAYDRAANLTYESVLANLAANGEYSVEELRISKSHITKETLGNSDQSPAPSSVENKKKRKRRNNSSKKSWLVGDKCKAKFSEDGLWYDAVILSVDRSRNRCNVRFAYYENEEEVSFGNLQRPTETSADEEESVLSGEDIECDVESQSSAANSAPATKAFHMGKKTLPPPAPPAWLSNSSEQPPDDDEAMSAMLMSWYMSGYHTGYYQAMRDLKRPQKK